MNKVGLTIRDASAIVSTMRKIIILAAVLFVSAIVAQADTNTILYNFSVKFKVSQQGAATTNSANIITYASPHNYAITNSFLLKMMATAENTLGNYTNTVFPSGSKLVLVNAGTNFNDDYFIVTDKHGVFLVDVSDLITIQEINSNYTQSGKINNVTGFKTKLNQGFVVEINYDDTKAGGTSAFYMIGLLTAQLNDKLKSTTYVATTAGSITSGVGDGTFAGKSALITASASFSSDQTFPLPTP